MKARLPKGMGGGPSNMQSVIRQAQKMQEEMLKAQEELGEKTVEASVGGGVVTVTANGKKELLVHYSPYSSTGMSAYQLQVFQLNGQEEVTLYEDETLFTVGIGEEFPENTPIFLKNANALMDKCTILLSTQNGEAVIGPASPEKLQKDNEELLAEILVER